MRIALHNIFFGLPVAETELCRRIAIAAKNIGSEAIEVSSSHEIHSYKPDAVFAMHHLTPKLSPYPTFGCMWNPLDSFDGRPKEVQKILSYDGYLAGEFDEIHNWLKRQPQTIKNEKNISPFYTSCNRTSFNEPNLTDPSLIYIGSNWDNRYKSLFQALDDEPYMEFYGKSDGWTFLKKSYKGTIPFDGESLLNKLNRGGVGLCLHSARHTNAGVPSMRIFEIIASGAVAICSRHPFIEQVFEKNVLYISDTDDFKKQNAEISGHLKWITENPIEAIEKARQAHIIFSEKYTLEKLIENFRSSFIKSKKINESQTQKSKVSVILSAHLGDAEKNGLATQTYKNITVFNTHDTKAFESDYICELNPGEIMHPKHIANLVKILDQRPNLDSAYSRSLLQYQAKKSELVYFKNPYNPRVFETTKLGSLLQKNAPLVRSNKKNYTSAHSNDFCSESFTVTYKLEVPFNFKMHFLIKAIVRPIVYWKRHIKTKILSFGKTIWQSK